LERISNPISKDPLPEGNLDIEGKDSGESELD